jgi:hypothetical protein
MPEETLSDTVHCATLTLHHGGHQWVQGWVPEFLLMRDAR